MPRPSLNQNHLQSFQWAELSQSLTGWFRLFGCFRLLKMPRSLHPILATLFLSLLTQGAWGGEVKAAIAANFASVMQQLKPMYEQQSGNRLIISFGSTGKLATQIEKGAPFEIFLSADTSRPLELIEKGLAIQDSLFVYARGQLVLWSEKPGLAVASGMVLRSGDFNKLAIANPRTAPYGLAAEEFLTRTQLYESVQPKLVYGDSIAQTYQFVMSGNADLGLLAWSQIKQPGSDSVIGSLWRIPTDLYNPIDQAAVLLVRSQGNPAASAFWQFLHSAPAKAVIADAGYLLN